MSTEEIFSEWGMISRDDALSKVYIENGDRTERPETKETFARRGVKTGGTGHRTLAGAKSTMAKQREEGRGEMSRKNSRRGVAPSTRFSRPRFRTMPNDVDEDDDDGLDAVLSGAGAIAAGPTNALDDRVCNDSPISRAAAIIVRRGGVPNFIVV
jgi:hypothetical protein